MQATQILLNNLLYDFSNFSIPSDTVDVEYIEKPKRLPGSALRDYMIWIGPISSIFDFATICGINLCVSCWGQNQTESHRIIPNELVFGILINANLCNVCHSCTRRYPFWLSETE